MEKIHTLNRSGVTVDIGRDNRNMPILRKYEWDAASGFEEKGGMVRIFFERCAGGNNADWVEIPRRILSDDLLCVIRDCAEAGRKRNADKHHREVEEWKATREFLKTPEGTLELFRAVTGRSPATIEEMWRMARKEKLAGYRSILSTDYGNHRKGDNWVRTAERELIFLRGAQLERSNHSQYYGRD